MLNDRDIKEENDQLLVPRWRMLIEQRAKTDAMRLGMTPLSVEYISSSDEMYSTDNGVIPRRMASVLALCSINIRQRGTRSWSFSSLMSLSFNILIVISQLVDRDVV